MLDTRSARSLLARLFELKEENKLSAEEEEASDVLVYGFDLPEQPGDPSCR